MTNLTLLDRRVALALTEIGQGQQHLTSVLLKNSENEVGAAVGRAARSLEAAATYIKGKSPHTLTIYEEKIATRAVSIAVANLPPSALPDPAGMRVLTKAVLEGLNQQMLDGSFDNQ